MMTDKCTEEDKHYMIDQLVAYNLTQVPATQDNLFQDLSEKMVIDGVIVAGVIARMYCWNCVYVDTLWVDWKYRGKGLGHQLMLQMEEHAKQYGAYLIHLDTFDFQAKEFYESIGYQLFGTLEGCPKNHCRYYLKKEIGDVYEPER